MSSPKTLLLTCAALTFSASFLGSAPAQADVTALIGNAAVTLGTTANSFVTDTSFSGTLGWSFTANSNLLVSSLGYFDNALVPGSGATAFGSHEVGLYSGSGASIGSLLASSTLSSTSTADPNGYFVYNSITPIVLTSGQTYTLGGVAGTDAYAYDLQNANPFDPNITYTQDAFDPSATPAQTLTTPSGTDGSPFDPTSNATATGIGYAYFGPTFRSVVVSAAPEPSELGMLAVIGLGLGGLLLSARRKSLRKN